MTKEETKAYKREWARNHRESMLAAQRRYYKTHKKQIKEYHQKNKDRAYLLRVKKRELNPSLKVQGTYYSLVRRCIDRYKHDKPFKKSLLETILGISKIKFVQYLEGALPKGKTIKKDYGKGSNKFEIDHIIPCNQFDLTKPEQLKICFNWRNMRLIKVKDNRSRRRMNTNIQEVK